MYVEALEVDGIKLRGNVLYSYIGFGVQNGEHFSLITVVRGQDQQIINSKNKNRILGKNIFF
jgi:hypothetical protein